VEIVPAARLRGVLTAASQRLTAADAATLVARARGMLRPA
jgi:hypothetical protein